MHVDIRVLKSNEMSISSQQISQALLRKKYKSKQFLEH